MQLSPERIKEMSPHSTTATRAAQSHPELVTLAEVADTLQITIQVARRLAHAGAFGPVSRSERERRRHAVERAQVESFQRFYQSPPPAK